MSSWKIIFSDSAICVPLRTDSIFAYFGFAVGKIDLSSISNRVTLDQVFHRQVEKHARKKHEDTELDSSATIHIFVSLSEVLCMS